MSEPPIRQAINRTQDTLVARAASYRNLVVIISLGGCGLLFSTLLTWNLKPLLGLCWLLPIVNAWLWLDARRVRQWSARILEICAVGQLDVEIFRSTILHLRHLPQTTLAGMLDMLPPSATAASKLAEEIAIQRQQALMAERSHLVGAAISGIACLVILSGLFASRWLVLLGLVLYIATPKLSTWIVDRR